jgi:hypothetical protein
MYTTNASWSVSFLATTRGLGGEPFRRVQTCQFAVRNVSIIQRSSLIEPPGQLRRKTDVQVDQVLLDLIVVSAR